MVTFLFVFFVIGIVGGVIGTRFLLFQKARIYLLHTYSFSAKPINARYVIHEDTYYVDCITNNQPYPVQFSVLIKQNAVVADSFHSCVANYLLCNFIDDHSTLISDIDFRVVVENQYCNEKAVPCQDIRGLTPEEILNTNIWSQEVFVLITEKVDENFVQLFIENLWNWLNENQFDCKCLRVIYSLKDSPEKNYLCTLSNEKPNEISHYSYNGQFDNKF